MLSYKRGRGVSLHIANRKCTACEACVSVCENRVIGMVYKENSSYATVEYIDRCIGCNKCVKACKVDAIELIKRQ